MTRPQIVLVPGLMNDEDLWRDQIPILSRVARPVIADITRGESLSALADAVLEAGEQRFALAGFSLGGIVAQEVMRKEPARVTHLALLDTTARPDDPSRKEERERMIAMARRPDKFHGFGEKMAANYLAARSAQDVNLVRRIREMTARLGADVFIRQSLIERPDGRADLRAIRCPALVLCGEDDRITPPSLHREMAGLLPNARSVILSSCGHLSPIEQGVEVARELVRLLTEQGGRSPEK